VNLFVAEGKIVAYRFLDSNWSTNEELHFGPIAL